MNGDERKDGMDVPEFGGIGDGLGDGEDAEEGIVLFDICGDVSHVKVGRAIKSDLHSRKRMDQFSKSIQKKS